MRERALGFAAALTEGSYGQSGDGLAPRITLRLSLTPSERLACSLSLMHGEPTTYSSIYFSGSALTPVGRNAGSTLGASPSQEVGTDLGELNLRWAPSERMLLRLSAGAGRVEDDADAFDRDLYWFVVEPSVRLLPDLQLDLSLPPDVLAHLVRPLQLRVELGVVAGEDPLEHAVGVVDAARHGGAS